MTNLLYSYLTALILTLITEGLVVFLFGGRKRLFLSVIGIDLISHPILHIILFSTLPIYVGEYGAWYLFVLEVLVVVSEFALLVKLGYEKRFSLELSICMNASSYLAGLLVL